MAAWELVKEYSAKETELKAESKILDQKRILQTQKRQAVLKTVTDVYAERGRDSIGRLLGFKS